MTSTEEKKKYIGLLDVPSAIVEQIAIFALGKPFEEPMGTLHFTCKEFWSQHKSYYQYYTLYTKCLAQLHEEFRDHETFCYCFLTFFRDIIQQYFKRDQTLIRELHLPYCKTCQSKIIDYWISYCLPDLTSLQHLQYILLDYSNPSLYHSLTLILDHCPKLHLHFTNTYLTEELEEILLKLFSKYNGRIHVGSLLLHSLKNSYSQKKRADAPYSRLNLACSQLWTTISSSTELERIRIFDPAVYRFFTNEFTSYHDALCKITRFPFYQTLSCFQNLPLEFTFRTFIHLLKTEHPSSSTCSAVINLPVLLKHIYEKRSWQIVTLWTIFKGYSYQTTDSTLVKIEFSLRQFYKLIQTHFDEKISLYDYFGKVYQRQVVCEFCHNWMNIVYANRNVKAEMCYICLLRRFLTFSNYPQLHVLLHSYGFSSNELDHALVEIKQSRQFKRRFGDLLWKSVEANNVKALVALSDMCKSFNMESFPSILYPDECAQGNGYIPQIHLLAQCSGACLAVLLDRFNISVEEVLQALCDVSEYAIERSQLSPQQREQHDRELPLFYQRYDELSPLRPHRVGYSSSSLRLNHHLFLFERDIIEIDLVKNI